MSKYTVANRIWKAGNAYAFASLFGFIAMTIIIALRELYPDDVSIYGAIPAAMIALTNGYFAYDTFRQAFDELYDRGV